MTKLFEMKIYVKKTKVDTLFNFDIIRQPYSRGLVKKIWLEFHDHPNHIHWDD